MKIVVAFVRTRERKAFRQDSVRDVEQEYALMLNFISLTAGCSKSPCKWEWSSACR